MAIAADSLVDPLRALTVLRTDLTQRLNVLPSLLIYSTPLQNRGHGSRIYPPEV